MSDETRVIVDLAIVVALAFTAGFCLRMAKEAYAELREDAEFQLFVKKLKAKVRK